VPPIRKYTTSEAVESINSIPLKYLLPSVNIVISPNAEVVSVSTNYGSYTYDNAPTMYYHDAGQPLVMTGSLTVYDPFTPVEWLWDFGDGSQGVGNPVNYTYTYGGQDIIVHLRVTDDQGRVAWGSLNPMLRSTGDSFRVGEGLIWV